MAQANEQEIKNEKKVCLESIVPDGNRSLQEKGEAHSNGLYLGFVLLG